MRQGCGERGVYLDFVYRGFGFLGIAGSFGVFSEGVWLVFCVFVFLGSMELRDEGEGSLVSPLPLLRLVLVHVHKVPVTVFGGWHCKGVSCEARKVGGWWLGGSLVVFLSSTDWIQVRIIFTFGSLAGGNWSSQEWGSFPPPEKVEGVDV